MKFFCWIDEAVSAAAFDSFESFNELLDYERQTSVSRTRLEQIGAALLFLQFSLFVCCSYLAPTSSSANLSANGLAALSVVATVFLVPW